jgi:ABC-2 type transport system ATP-binding protein
VSGVRDLVVDGNRATLSFDGEMAALLSAADGRRLRDVSTQDADLEEIFLTYYQDEPGTVS